MLVEIVESDHSIKFVEERLGSLPFVSNAHIAK